MTAPSRTATPARLATVAAVLAILATLLVRPALGPGVARAMGPLPDCRYDDILTTPRGYADWPTTLVDTILRVPKGYVPPDLVSTAQAGITGGDKVRAVMIDDLRAMTEAAAAAGNAIGVQSAYRSYAEQKDVFDSWVQRYGYNRALEVSARPGHSEHQLGLAIDFRSEPGGSPFTGTWGTSPAGKWMKAHAWEYGFVMSYPKGTMAAVCYDYEPWHFRYVGRDLAALIHASGLTPARIPVDPLHDDRRPGRAVSDEGPGEHPEANRQALGAADRRALANASRVADARRRAADRRTDTPARTPALPTEPITPAPDRDARGRPAGRRDGARRGCGGRRRPPAARRARVRGWFAATPRRR